jgi:TrpR family trp operon transcriptional repressor
MYDAWGFDMKRRFEGEGWRPFVELCAKAQGVEALEDLFWLFLTAKERKDIATRYQIVKELIRGEKTQREMARDLKVSIAKITRGSNFLKLANEKLKEMF